MAVSGDPIETLTRWYAEAEDTEPRVPDAMQLATVGPDGRPSMRTVLLKSIEARGLVFYTNYTSRKGRELEGNPQVVALLHWKDLKRQVVIEGRAERLSDGESDAYFATRDRGSQLGAWASDQSQEMGNRAVLVARVGVEALKYGIGAVPRPSFWGGYRIVPDRFEFWQDRPSRLHERYELVLEEGAWVRRMLFP